MLLGAAEVFKISSLCQKKGNGDSQSFWDLFLKVAEKFRLNCRILRLEISFFPFRGRPVDFWC